MKFFRFFGTAAAVLLACGCASEAPVSRTFFAMDTVMTVTAYGSEKLLTQCGERIAELDSLLSAQKPDSDTSRLNASEGKETELSSDTAALLCKALDFCRETNGIYDPTVYPLVKEWGFIGGDYKIPDSSRISKLLVNTGFEKITLNGNTASIPAGFELDFGACAKGYAADELKKILTENGVKSALLDLGGNIQTIGCKSDGSPWIIGVADPFSPSESAGTLLLSDCAVITSGGYERYFIGDDGKRYCHIIDPRTGCPADSGIASVTVVGQNAARCDMLSTALFIMGTDEAIDFWRSSDDFEMLIITEERKMLITEGLSEKYTQSENYSGAEVIRK